MFSVSKELASYFNIGGKSKLIEDTFLKKFGPVTQVFQCPGHIFVLLKEGQRLVVFDTLPATIRGRDGNGLDKVYNHDAAVSDIIFLDVGRNTNVLVVLENGQLQNWIFDSSNYKWGLRREIQLSVNAPISVVYHSLYKVLYWCEKANGNIYNVMYKSLTKNSESIALGPAETVVVNCPKPTLYECGNKLLIFPSLPQTVYLLYQGMTLHVHTYSNGRVYSTDNSQQTHDFKILMKITTTYWSQVQMDNTRVLAMVPCSFTNQVYVIFHSGQVKYIKDEGSLGRVTTLSTEALDQIKLDKILHWSIVNGYLVTFSTNIIRTFSLFDGTAIQVIKLSGEHCTCIWDYQGPVNKVGFSTNKQLCCLQTSNPGSSVDSQQPHFYELAGKRSLAVQLALEETVKYYQARSVKGTKLTDSILLNNTDVFQSPALLVALLEQGKEKVPCPDTYTQAHRLQEHMREDKLLPTELNHEIGPLLNSYWKLADDIKSIINSEKLIETTSGPGIREELYSLIESTTLTVEEQYTRLNILLEHFPEEVVQYIIEYLGFETEEMTPDQATRWINLVSTSPSEGQTPMFEFIGRLFYKYRPDILFDFVKMSQGFLDKNLSLSAFSRSSPKESLIERALSSLPAPEYSCDKEKALDAYVQLTLASSDKQCYVHAVQTLVHYQSWDKAIDLVSQRANHSNEHAVLFHILFPALLQNDVFPTYYNQVMQLVPNKIIVSELLSVIEKYSPRVSMSSKYTEEPIIFSDSSQVSVGMMRTHLLQLMNKEQGADREQAKPSSES